MKENTKYFPILIFAAVALGVVLGTMLNFPVPDSGYSANSQKNKLKKIIDFIDNEYVDSINTDSIVDLAVSNILEKLDPHSVYIEKNEMTEIAQSMKGDFVGIGINFYMFKDTVAVIKPIANGPSEKAGILAGDRILYANKSKLFGKKMPSDSLYSKLKGEVGSQINLTVYRKTTKKTLHILVNRNHVAIKSVDIGLMLNPTVGYIKINRFAETTYNEFKKELLLLKKQGAKSLIIDVRENGGGYLEKAVEIADDFLPKDQLIVFTKNKKGRIDKTYATQNGSFETGNVFVLINENSASASEILAGALQDNDRATIVGRRSFGKGLVQREMNFEDGSAVRLTVARYYTPTGRSIQKSYKKGNDDYYKDFDNRFKNGELYKKDSIKVNDSLKFKTKKGKIVYGGGGIVPDIFVPLEIENADESIAYLLQSGALGFFVFEQLDLKRADFNGLNFEKFVKKIENTDLYFKNFEKYLTKNKLDIKISRNKRLVNKFINAEFVRQLYGEKEYFGLMLKDDGMIKAVLKN
jgi:carboxyl-terminal processing protease